MFYLLVKEIKDFVWLFAGQVFLRVGICWNSKAVDISASLKVAVH